MRLVIYPAFADERIDRIRAAAPDLDVVDASDEAAAVAAVGTAEAFFGKMTPAILERAAALRWIQAPTASLEHYLFPALESHPAIVTNMRGIHAKPIAEQVLGYLTAFARNLHRYARLQADGRWAPVGGETERSSFATGPGRINAIDRQTHDLAGATLGIIGLGAIGRAVAQRAVGFEMTIIGVDAQVVAVDRIAEILPPAGLDDVLGRSDFVVVTLPHTPETVGLFDADRFAAMRSTAFFVNVGRGVVVRLDDLVAALRNGLIAGAALDVFEIEPLPAGHPLWAMDNVILTPHVSGFSARVAGNFMALFLDNLERFRDGRPLRNEVEKTRWY